MEDPQDLTVDERKASDWLKEYSENLEDKYSDVIIGIKAHYPWDQCIADNKKRYGSQATAERVCGMIRGKYGHHSPGIEMPGEPDMAATYAAIEKELGVKPKNPKAGTFMAPSKGKSVEVEDELDDELVYYAGAVKALDDGKVGGYLVRFSSERDPDLTGQFFTKDTDFGDATHSDVYYHHGVDKGIKKRRLGTTPLAPDDFGIWAEAQLNLEDKYEKFLYQRAKKGKLGWSSGTLPNLIEVEPIGKEVEWIKKWPLGLDASLTLAPTEWRNRAMPLKALTVQPLLEDEPMDAPAGEPAEQDGDAAPEANDTKNLEVPENETMDITQEQLDEMLLKAAEAGAEKALKSLPAKMTDVQVTKDEADQEFPPEEFFKAVKTVYLYPGNEDPRLKPLKATGLSEGVPADGGYLLAPQVASGIIERMYTTGDILTRVASDPVGANSNSITYNAVDETSRADGSRWGGVRGYWVGEAGTLTASKPKFREMMLKLKKVAALAYATDEQLADTTALASWLNRTVPEELRFMTEDAIINGNGVAKPLGILNSPCLNEVTRVDANEIDATDIATMWSRRWAGVKDYVWLADSSIFPQLINLTIGNFPLLLPVNGGIQGAPTFSIYGRPYIETEHNQDLGTEGDLILASLSQYQAINKGGVQAATSIHVQFVTDETAFRFIYRIDGQPTWNSTLTPKSGGDAKGPFVVLTAASA